MKKINDLTHILTALLLALPTVLHGADAAPGGRPGDLRCEYRHDPLGIDVARPGLSWRLEAAGAHPDGRGQRQTAYHVLVASTAEQLAQDEGDLWDSGKVASDQNILVEYAGKPLDSRQRCHWKVRVHDKDGKASGWSPAAEWTMGLLKPEDWQAHWISAPGEPPTSADIVKLTVTKATYRTLDGSVEVDVTELVRKELAGNKPLTVRCKTLGGDPAPDMVKELVVDFIADGQAGTARAKDFHVVPLPGRPMPVPGKAAPLFRKEFDLAASPASALITVHSLNYFEVYINGSKVGQDVLTPAVSNPEHQSFAVTYDVSRHLRPGRNCLGLWVGEGWKNGIAVRAQLDATVEGKPVTIGTDASWQTRKSGLSRIGGRKWNDFGGERVDARDLTPNWSMPGLNTASWAPAVLVQSPAATVRSQPCPLNRIGKVIPAAAVTALDRGRYEIDFGTALTGWLRLKMPALQPGTRVKMTFADVRRGDDYQHFNQVSEFISAGKTGESFENKFNYAGFRYVIVEGLPSAPAREDATAMLVESDLDEVGAFECSNDLFNRIHRVNQWTQRCLNLGGYYVDCPHRERLGYGDGQVAAEGFMTSFRADGFYSKWLRDWRLRQSPDGNLPHVAPQGAGGGGPGWGGLFSAITWRHYLYYGDRRVLEENYETVRRYVDYLESICKDGVMRKFGGKWDFIGDWVPPGRGMDTKNWPGTEAAELFNNCYRINQMALLTRMAAVLGKSDDAARYNRRLAEIRPLVHAAFYDVDRQEYVIDEQAYYVMPLMTGIVPESERVLMLKKLEQNILVKNRGHLDTGMLGTYFMMEHLREIGRNDLVCTMFNQTTHPGWGHMLAAGATTFWEQWNGHWSHIHSCFTSPDNWFYQGLAGIQPDPAAPGFRNVIIKPAIVGDLTWVKCHHDSPYGRIMSNWKHDGEMLSMDVTIPSNSTATIFVPAKDATSVTESGNPAEEAEAVRFLRMENNTAVYAVASGTYHFQSRMVPPVAIHAANATPALQLSAAQAGNAVPQERMQQVYEEVKTPYKYGIVLRGAPNQVVDSPSVFRKDGQWYMVYVASTANVGYETCLARSADLVNWEKLGNILSFRDEGWDRWQRGGYIALSDPTWGGSNELQTYDGRYWMSYLGGALKGYETDPLAIGLAWTTTPTEAREWTPLAENPVLHRNQPDVRPFEKVTLYKSNIVWDKAKTLGSQFVMFYNGKISGGYEKIGLAVSDDLVNWKRHGADSVVANGEDGKHGITGDPQVVKMGDLWVMFYFGAFWRPGAFDTFACSTDLVNWTQWRGPDLVKSSEPWDRIYAHKPWMIKHEGCVYHFYCAVGDQGRVIALATSKDLKMPAAADPNNPQDRHDHQIVEPTNNRRTDSP